MCGLSALLRRVCVYLDDVFDADVFQARAAAAADLVDDAVWSAAGHGELASGQLVQQRSVHTAFSMAMTVHVL